MLAAGASRLIGECQRWLGPGDRSEGAAAATAARGRSGTRDSPAPPFGSTYAGAGWPRCTGLSYSCHKPQPASSMSSAPGMTKNHVNRLKFGRLSTDL